MTCGHEPDPVSQYTAALATTLHGPRRAKARLVGEVADGLREAATAHQANLDHDSAVEQAIAEFGRPHELVAACQSELTIRQTRTTALVLMTAVASLLACWHLLWAGAAVEGWALVAVIVAIVPALCAVLAGATVAITGRAGRGLPTPGCLPHLTTWIAMSTSVAMLIVTAALLMAGEGNRLAPLAVCATVTVGMHGVLASSARSCRRCSALDSVRRTSI